jgi:hypothetical protein
MLTLESTTESKMQTSPEAGSGAMPAIQRAVVTSVVAAMLVLGSCTSAAQPAADWIDEMPSVPVVVQAVREQFEVVRKGTSGKQLGDADELAEHLVGTFILLRWVMRVSIDEEGSSPTAAARHARVRDITRDYHQAELAIGLGAGRRNGYVVKICARQDSWSRAQWPEPAVCHRRSFQVGFGGAYQNIAFRHAMLARLFCARVPHYTALLQRHPPPRPPVPSPARTFDMPAGEPNIGSGFCTRYGGDATGDGLCDDWQRPLVGGRAQRGGAPACERPATQAPITIHRLTQGGPQTVLVEFTRNAGPATSSVRFDLRRTNQAMSLHKPIAHTLSQTFTRGFDGKTQIAALHIRAEDLVPDRELPWLAVLPMGTAVSTGSRCRQVGPLPPIFDAPDDRLGFFGPFETADQAALAVERIARVLTERKRSGLLATEVGVLILAQHHGTTVSPRGPYMVTSFAYGTEGRAFFGDGPTISIDQYKAGETEALRISCSAPFGPSSYYIAGLAHTHPWNFNVPFVRWGVEFSSNDLEQAFQLRQGNKDTFEKSYLFATDHCVYAVTGVLGDVKAEVGCR